MFENDHRELETDISQTVQYGNQCKLQKKNLRINMQKNWIFKENLNYIRLRQFQLDNIWFTLYITQNQAMKKIKSNCNKKIIAYNYKNWKQMQGEIRI